MKEEEKGGGESIGRKARIVGSGRKEPSIVGLHRGKQMPFLFALLLVIDSNGRSWELMSPHDLLVIICINSSFITIYLFVDSLPLKPPLKGFPCKMLMFAFLIYHSNYALLIPLLASTNTSRVNPCFIQCTLNDYDKKWHQDFFLALDYGNKQEYGECWLT